MPVEVIMPKVDMDMASGKLIYWHVAVGEKVEKGAPLFDIETDKAAMEVEAPASGILYHPVEPGTDVPIGQPVAWLYAADETVAEAPDATHATANAQTATSIEALPVAALSTTEFQPHDTETGVLRATPLARNLAREAGVDLKSLVGSGPHGRVQADDVREKVKRLTPAPAVLQFHSETGPLYITRSRGGTGTPVVLLHGFASDSLSWAPLEAYLPDRPLIRIDLPGHGKSPKQRIASFAALAAKIRDTFDGLFLDRAHLLGHSLGGALALALADTRPRSVATVTMIAPGGLGPEINGPALHGICGATRAESLEPWLRSLVADERRITEAYVRIAMAGRQDPVLRQAQTAMAEVLFPDGVQAFDLRAALARLEMPARILWGRQDQIIPWRHALRAPGAVSLHLFDGVGHVPQFEAAEKIAKVLRPTFD